MEYSSGSAPNCQPCAARHTIARESHPDRRLTSDGYKLLSAVDDAVRRNDEVFTWRAGTVLQKLIDAAKRDKMSTEVVETVVSSQSLNCERDRQP